MKKATILPLIAILFFYSCSPKPIQSIRPMQPNIVAGGRAVAVTRHPTNDKEFFVASESGGIFRSLNGGANWLQVSGSSTFWFTDVEYCKENPSIVIATAQYDTKVLNGGGVWRSTNGGANWHQVPLYPPNSECLDWLSGYCVTVEAGNNKIWVGTSCGLAVSTDNGANFSFISPSANYNNDKVYAVLAPEPNKIKIVTDYGIKTSEDGGISWFHSTTGLPSIIHKGTQAQIACSPLNHKHIFWAFKFDRPNGKKGSALYFSPDNGSTWKSLLDNDKNAREPTCYTANSVSGPDKFDLYYSDGEWTFKRAPWGNPRYPFMVDVWIDLKIPHSDMADLCFRTDGKTPALLAGDGGLFLTTNAGLNWTFTGGGKSGYNALQVTEVAGQLHNDDDKSDLYFGTQDNSILSSPDGGATWPESNRYGSEGYFLNVPRQRLPATETRIAGVQCGNPCGNFISGKLFSGATNFPNPPNSTWNPKLLKPGSYLQSGPSPDKPNMTTFWLTTDNGSSWKQKYSFINSETELSKVAGHLSDPVVFTPVKNPGITSDGNEIVGIKRIVGIFSDKSSPLVSDVTGFGSLGTFPTMFAWYRPFGVNTFNPNHIIVPDITTDKIRVTWDGGMNWVDDDNLTNLVTESGKFRFRRGGFVQVSNISFDPDGYGRILVGTVQAGIFLSCDNGNSWGKIYGSEKIPNISSFYFASDNKVIVSSYGRGLWELDISECDRRVNTDITNFQRAEPLIYWLDTYTPINQVHSPITCPYCGYYVTKNGDITKVDISKENELISIAVTNGSIKGFTHETKVIDSLPFTVTTSQGNFDVGNDEKLSALIQNGYKVKGVLVEGKIFKGLIMSKEDVGSHQLPKEQEIKTYLKATLIKDTGNIASVKLTALGFDKNLGITIYIDGKKIDEAKTKSFLDNSGNTVFIIHYPIIPGPHKILLEQKNGLRETTTLIIPKNEPNEIKPFQIK